MSPPFHIMKDTLDQAKPPGPAVRYIIMHNLLYYRGQAAMARRLAASTYQRELLNLLGRVAQDYDDIADDLENGAITIRHAELMPQLKRDR